MIFGNTGLFCFSFRGISLHCIFLFRNVPHIHVHEKRENKEWWHGAEIQIVIEGNWTTYRVCISYIVFVTDFLSCFTSFMQWKQLTQIIHFLYLRKMIFSFCVYSLKYCIICDKWLSSHLMPNSFSDLCQILLSTLSLLLSLLMYLCLQGYQYIY